MILYIVLFDDIYNHLIILNNNYMYLKIYYVLIKNDLTRVIKT